MKKGSYLDCLVTRNKISPPWIIALAISIPLKKKKKLTPNYMRINIPGKIKTSGSSYYFCSEYKQATLLNNQAHSLQLRSTLSRLKPLITYLLLLFLFLGSQTLPRPDNNMSFSQSSLAQQMFEHSVIASYALGRKSLVSLHVCALSAYFQFVEHIFWCLNIRRNTLH